MSEPAKVSPEEALQILEDAWAYYTPAEDMVAVMEAEIAYYEYLEAA